MTITITVSVDLDTDEPILAERVAAQLQEKVDAMELTLDGVTSVTHHTVPAVKVGKPKK